MNSYQKMNSSNIINWDIPLWFKIVVTLFPLGFAGVFIRALFVQQSVLLGLELGKIVVMTSILFVVSGLFTVYLWRYPDRVPSRFLYWSLCLFRDHIRVLSLLGILYLVTIRAPFISLRGGALYLLSLLMLGVGIFLRTADLDDIPHLSLEPVFNFLKRLISKIGSGSSVVFWGFVAIALPLLIVLFIVYFLFGAKLSNYGPFSFWNDEVAYWVWLRSFSYVGFNSGYNLPNELLPVFEFSRYGEASPFYLYVYGPSRIWWGGFLYFPYSLIYFLSACQFFFLSALSNWMSGRLYL